MVDNVSYMPPVQSPSSEKRKIILLLGGAVILLLLFIFLFVQLRGSDSTDQQQLLPTPTPLPGQSNTFPVTIAPENVERKLNKTVKNIHWMSNNELAYTYYDRDQRETILAKTNSDTLEENLAEQILIKFATFYWSEKNDLLIHELSAPSKAYLLPNGGNIQNLNLRGDAYSWSPDGTRLLFREYQSDSLRIPRFYSLSSRTSSPITTQLPEFTHSLWSPDGSTILLYTIIIGSHDNNPFLFNINSLEITPLATDFLESPQWSPSGASLAYINNQGLYVKNNSGADRVYYKPSGPSQTVTYTWINEQEILVIDSSRAATKIISVPLYSQGTKEVFTSLSLRPDQRVEVSLSPDKKTLALATEKDGLLFVSLQ